MDEYGCGFLTEAERMQQRDYSLSAMATRFELAEMPSGRRTFHRLSLSSTLSRMDASPGGYSAGDATRKKTRRKWVRVGDGACIERESIGGSAMLGRTTRRVTVNRG